MFNFFLTLNLSAINKIIANIKVVHATTSKFLKLFIRPVEKINKPTIISGTDPRTKR